MGSTNFLTEGGTATGKTSVCEELGRRGYQAIHSDGDLAYQGGPNTGKTVDAARLAVHHHHIWCVDVVKAIIIDQREMTTFFCGGSRNFAKFVGLFDGVFVLDVDVETLTRRLDEQPEGEWGGRVRHAERNLTLRLHRTGEDVPQRGIVVEDTAPLAQVSGAEQTNS